MSANDLAELRERLVTLRRDLVGRLAASLDGGRSAWPMTWQA
jgi:hypothetical protein